MYSSNDPDDGFLHTLDLSPTQLYYSDQWQVLESRRSTGATIEQYVWSAAYVDAVVERDRNGDNDSSTGNRGKSGSGLEQRTYALQDANWNTTAVVLVHDDDWVELVDRILYDPYGAPAFLYSDWTPDTNYAASVSSWIYLPQGGRYDPATGLVDKRNRVYSTSLGRPVQTDPKGYPDGLNRYQWEGSNPISRLDPSGESWLGDKWESVKSAANTLANSADNWVLTAKMLMTNEEVQNSFTEHLDEDMHDGALAAINGLTGVEIFGDDWMYDPCNPMLQYSEDLGKFASAMLQLAAGIEESRAGLELEQEAAACENSCFVAGTPVLLGDGCTQEAIDQVRVGQRVATDGGIANSGDGKTKAEDIDATRVDPQTWRLVNLEVDARTANGGIDVMQVQELMPVATLQALHAKAGSHIPVPLDLGDISEAGEGAIVESIDPCPEIKTGPGRVVLTTITHLNNYGFHLTLGDASGRTETLGITGFHKLYTEDRGWASAADLRRGEHIRGQDGDLTVVSLVRDPGIHRVYNLTVEADHVYYVGTLKSLSHNIIECALDYRNRMEGNLPNPHEVSAAEAPKFMEDLETSIDYREWNYGEPLNDGHIERLELEKALLEALRKIFG
jgi:RHS repeat-associated protein